MYEQSWEKLGSRSWRNQAMNNTECKNEFQRTRRQIVNDNALTMYQSEVASEVTLLGASDRVLLGGYSQGRLPGQAAAGMSTLIFVSFILPWHQSLSSCFWNEASKTSNRIVGRINFIPFLQQSRPCIKQSPVSNPLNDLTVAEWRWRHGGGCISLAVGLALPYDLGLIVSQRGMLMKQTMLGWFFRRNERMMYAKIF